MNIFETATREKFRFPSRVGMLAVENLWDLPLTSANKPSLDDTARRVNAELKSVTEESFVATTSNPDKERLETKLEIVKHVIAVRLAENEARRSEAARKAEKEKLLGVLDRKQDAALENLSEEALRERINAL